MPEILAFYSSDARELYKADAFRALTLPKKYVLQVRYRKALINPNLLVGLAGLKDKLGLMSFVSGNDLTVAENLRNLTHHPIRLVTVKDVYDDSNTNLVHFYLEMGDFSDTAVHAGTPAAQLPPHFFVTRVTTQDMPVRAWIDRVTQISPHFPNRMLFYVTGVKHKGKTIEPVYSKDDRASRYPLTEESGYQVEISFYDPKGGKAGLVAVNSSEDASLNLPDLHRVGAERDTKVFELHTHTLATKHVLAHTHLKERDVPPVVAAPAVAPVAPPAPDPAAPVVALGGAAPVAAPLPAPAPAAAPVAGAASDLPLLDVHLQWYVTRGSWKPWLFGLLSVVAVTGLGLAKVAADDLDKVKMVWGNFWLGVLAAACLGIPAGLLYWLFHKK